MAFMLEEVPGTEVYIKEEGKSVLTFCYGESVLHSYFHPICTSNGQVMTEASDEKHPTGLCFTFGNAKDIDGNLTELNKVASTIDKKVSNISGANGAVSFACSTTWNASELGLIQSSKFTIHPLQKDVRVIDVSIEMDTISDTLVFEDNIGLGFNAVEMDHRKVANSDGRIGESEVNGQESAWVTLCGISGDTAVGIAILPYKNNGKTIFHVEDVYRGFIFAHNSPVSIIADEKHTLNYRILIYLGDLFTFDVHDYYKKYINR